MFLSKEHKIPSIKKYGKLKICKIFNVEKAMILEDDMIILFIDELDATVLKEKIFYPIKKGF